MSDHLMHTYARQAVAFERGEGSWLYDKDGKRYLDLLAGIAVVSLGHSHPKITQVIQEQCAKLMQVSNGFEIPEQSQLADTMCRLSGMDNVFFCSTGAEALECAIKIARYWGNKKGIALPTIIAMDKAFHGRTMATISAGGNQKVREGFEPHLEGFIHIPYNDAFALNAALAENDSVVAVLLEPIQGEGGINVPADDFLKQVRDICDEHGVLMMLDEVQTGVGRTGQYYAYQHSDILPDVVASAKALGNGYPIGACLAQGEAAEVLGVGSHGTTYGGNPLASRVAQTVFEVLEQDKLLEHVNEVGAYFIEQLNAHLGKHSCVKEIRGKGLMIGIELDRQCTDLRPKGLDKGLVFNVTAQKVIRLVPPLTISREEVDLAVQLLDELITDWSK